VLFSGSRELYPLGPGPMVAMNSTKAIKLASPFTTLASARIGVEATPAAMRLGPRKSLLNPAPQPPCASAIVYTAFTRAR